MIAAYITGAVSGVEVIGPNVLVVVASRPGSAWPDIAIATVNTVAMLAVAVAGIRLTARTQVAMAIAEYAILAGVAVAGLYLVLHHAPGTFPVTHPRFTLSGIGGRGRLSAGLLAAVFIYSGWEGTLYVSEEVKHRRVNPGRAAIAAVVILTALYVLVITGLQGVVPPPAALQAHATGTSIVLTARIILGMASWRALPGRLATISGRFATPVNASILTGVLIIALTWAYLLATSVQGAFDAIVDTSGLLFGVFYALTALATIVYYRRRVLAGPARAVTLGVLPLGAAAFLGWILVRSVQTAPAPQNWSLAGVLVLGVTLMLLARYGLRSQFFGITRESDPGRTP
jgi:amino acid transporter